MQAGSLRALSEALTRFVSQREWEQFHSPKILSMALTVEAAELQELFQWLSSQASRSLSAGDLARAREEIGDVFIYLILLADKLEIDLVEAANDKMLTNATKYPAEKVRGRSDKYTRY